jgi:hypothetical protein
MRTWLLTLGLLCAGPAWYHAAAPDEQAARFERMSEQEKAQIRERLRQYKPLP